MFFVFFLYQIQDSYDSAYGAGGALCAGMRGYSLTVCTHGDDDA